MMLDIKEATIGVAYVGVVVAPVADLKASGISQVVSLVASLYQYLLPPSAVYSFQGPWAFAAR